MQVRGAGVGAGGGVHRHYSLALLYALVAAICCLHLHPASASREKDIAKYAFFQGAGAGGGEGGGGMPEERYLVLLLTRLGLANRLRTMADWYQIAAMSRRTLLVSWEPTLDCNAKFDDLFVDGPEHLKVLPMALTMEEVKTYSREGNLSYYNLNDEGSDITAFQLTRRIISLGHNIVATTHDGLIALEGVGCQQYLHMHSEFLNSLVPNEYISSMVVDIKRKYFTNVVMVGVHFRLHDEVQDWAVVPPLTGAISPRATKFGEGATVSHFEGVMRLVQNKLSYSISDDTADNAGQGQSKKRTVVRFFIASNDDASKKQLLAHFPDSVFLSGEYSRSSADGIELALMEWLILSESALIINTYGSSFAVEASQRKMKPIVGIWEGMLVHHTSPSLPYCGHLQFAKLHATNRQEMRYTEGTHDEREITTVAIPLAPCPQLREWGFTEDVLLCTQ